MDESHIDVLAVGEALVDMISDTVQGSLHETQTFRLYPGGEVTNVALNVALLGGAAALVAGVGDDAFGQLLHRCLEVAGVGTTHVHTIQGVPTTLVAVTRSHVSPDFMAYRGADTQMTPNDLPMSLLSNTSFVHTSAFALSQEPACSAIMWFLEQAYAQGCQISFDPNYHPRLWKVAHDPLSILARFCPYVFVTKPSLDDCIRLFGPGQTPEAYVRHFLDLGVKHVVLTLGQDGALLATVDGITSYPASQVEVVDVTGAGDSFWSGMLLAVLDGYAMKDAVRVGLEVAAIKVQQVGPLTQRLDRRLLYQRLGLV